MKNNEFKMYQGAEKMTDAREKIRIFENIKTPQELTVFMKENIKYGYVGKNSKKIYSWKDKDSSNEAAQNFKQEYFLQSPEDLIESGNGVCLDSAELERRWFEKNEYEYKVFLSIFLKEYANDLPTHTFLAYRDGNKWFWFEHSFGLHRGIHEYDSLEDLVSDVKEKCFKSALEKRGATTEDEKDQTIFEFEKPKYGCNMQEFVDHATSGIRL